MSQINAKTSCLNPWSGHNAAAKKCNFLSQEEVGGINGIKSPYTHVKTEISASKSMFHSFHAVLWSMAHTHKFDISMHSGQVLKWQKFLVSNIFNHFLFAVSLSNWASKMSEKFKLDRKIGYQNMFYTKCINVIIDSIGPSIILRSILMYFNRLHAWWSTQSRLATAFLFNCTPAGWTSDSMTVLPFKTHLLMIW